MSLKICRFLPPHCYARTVTNIRTNIISPQTSMANIIVADSMGVSSFVFTQLSPKVRQKNLIKPTMATYFSIKWHFTVIQGQALDNAAWNFDKALHDAA